MTVIRQCHVITIFLFVLCAPLFALTGQAQDATITATIGFAEMWKPATWTPVRVVIESPGVDLEGRITITTTDNRGGQAHFVRDEVVSIEAGQPYSCFRYIRIGDPNGRVEISLESTSGDVSVSAEFPVAPGSLKLSRTWVVALGDPLGIDSLGTGNLIDRTGTVDVATVGSEGMPDEAVGFEGVDLLVLPIGQAGQVTGLTEDRIAAIEDWVRRGGRVLITGGTSAGSVIPQAPWLRELLGIDDGPIEVVSASPAALESYVAAKERLSAFDVARLNVVGGEQLLAVRTVDRESLPLIYERLHGFGRVMVVAADLDQPPFTGWSERDRILTQLFPELLIDTRNRDATSVAGMQEGYQDLGGQLNAALDRPAGGAVTFSWVAGLMILYLGLIGPLDYFLINRWLGKPVLGWLSFFLLVVAGTAAAGYWSTAIRTDRVVSRTIEFVDIFPEAGVGRGRGWTRLQSGTAGPYSASLSAADARLGWLGVAGTVYGGFEPPAALADSPTYRVVKSDEAAAIESLPIEHSGSRGLESRWTPARNIARQQGLERIQGSDLVRGDVRNPLDVDLLDGVLIFRNRIYMLPTRLQAGQIVRNLDQLNQRNFAWRLTRRQLLEGNSSAEPWDRAQLDDLPRVVEIAQFFTAAGGRNYTGLSSRPLRELDLSYLLSYDHAILAGRITEGDAELEMEIPNPAAELHAEKETFIRIILPVAGTRSSATTES